MTLNVPRIGTCFLVLRLKLKTKISYAVSKKVNKARETNLLEFYVTCNIINEFGITLKQGCFVHFFALRMTMFPALHISHQNNYNQPSYNK